MPENETAPPSQSEGGGNEAEEAAWEMATAETLRTRGELAEAANWYRRAANHLMEAGDDERAIAVAKLAAELAALDDAGKPQNGSRSSMPRAGSAVPPEPAKGDDRTAKTAAPPGDKPREKLPWQRDDAPRPAEKPRTQSPARPTAAPPDKSAAAVAKPSLSRTAPERPTQSPPNAAAGAAPSAARSPGNAPKPAPARPGSPSTAASAPLPTPSKAPPAPRAGAPAAPRTALSKSALPMSSPASARAVRAPNDAEAADDGKTTQFDLRNAAFPDETTSVVHGGEVSPIAALVDEAVSRIEETPQRPLSGAPEKPSRRPTGYTPQRAAECEQIAARLPALPLFSDFAPDRLREVSRQASIVRFTAGESLCEAGAPEGAMFVLIEGSAVVSVSGSESATAVVGAGDHVGEISALYGGPRTANVVAQGNVEAVALAPSLVRGLAHEFPPFREALESTIRERILQSLPHMIPMLRKFRDAERRDLCKRFDLVAVPEGSLILTEGAAADAVCVIAAGEAEIYGGTFGSARAHRARVGEAMGLASVSTGEPAASSARALRGMLIARMPRTRFREALQSYPMLSEAISDIGAPGSGVVF